MTDDPTRNLELPAGLLDDLAKAADASGVEVERLAEEWLRDRLVHEREKQEGVARRVRG